VDLDGKVLGQHKGIEFFTVGQRRGIGIQVGEPLYVISLDADTHRVVVGPESALNRGQFRVSRVNYTSGLVPAEPVEVSVKIRYKSKEAQAVLYPQGEEALVCFHEPQRALTPGQAAVFYQGNVLLGGGIIESSHVELGQSEWPVLSGA
jgi:tRNA-specific 2-thiouridylase